MPLLDGPRLPAKSRRARQLVVFLHGYGADGNDLIEIGRQWQTLLPEAAFVAPHAPEACAGAPMGRQWFALTMRDSSEQWCGVNQARPGLDAFLDRELERQGLNGGSLALVGFSQGTMMALHAGLRRRVAPAAILGYSGLLVGPEHLGEAGGRTADGRWPAILLAHGSEDQLIPLKALFMSAQALAKAGIPCQWHISLGVGHGIDAGGLTHGALFLAGALGVRISAQP